jgi:hypothetical protein
LLFLLTIFALSLSLFIGNIALYYGVRWGVGHSVGLLLVASILLIIESSSSKEAENEEEVEFFISDDVAHFFEGSVGAFMIALGAYGYYKAIQKHN